MLARQDLLQAGASIVGGTGAALVTRGGIVPARTGVGVYTLTLNQEADQADAIILATLRGAVDGRITVEHTSDAVKTVRTFSAAGAAADLSFDVLVMRIASGLGD